MDIKKEGSVRVDLLGGTLDIKPLHLILKNVVTLNVATSLKARVHLTNTDDGSIQIISKDYNDHKTYQESDFTEENFSNGFFEHYEFVALLLHILGLHRSIKIELESGSPPGAGLGGSSAMGATIFSALLEAKQEKMKREEIIQIVGEVEAKILAKGPAGYQDYFPALYGGVLSLEPTFGEVRVHQLFNDELKDYLENHLTLVYSGKTRLSGINNWEVYKAFFDGDEKVRAGLQKIADLSNEAFQAIKNKDYAAVKDLIASEGKEREKLFPGILSKEMKGLFKVLKDKFDDIGMKVCGAGGGGCFLITHKSEDAEKIRKAIKKEKLEILEFSIERPII